MRYDPMLIGSVENNKYSVDAKNGSPLYMFRFHRDRILDAAKHFEWHAAITTLSDLSKLETRVMEEVSKFEAEQGKQQPLKLRLVVKCDGSFTVGCAPCAATTLACLYPSSLSPTFAYPTGTTTPMTNPWIIKIDTVQTPATAYTRYKTTVRAMYNTARANVGITSWAEPCEVLLQNPAGELTEGSFTSCFFFRNGRWVTPPVSCGGNQGTTRRYMLERTSASKEPVTVASMTEGEEVWVTNGVKGCLYGRVKLGSASKQVPAAVTEEKEVAEKEPLRKNSSAGSGGWDGIPRKSTDSGSSQARELIVTHQKKRRLTDVKSMWKDWIMAAVK